MTDKVVKVAIVYHCVPHYREPIFRLLCEQDEGVEYTIVSGISDNSPALKTVDFNKANLPLNQGGLRWRIIKNVWLNKKILWQRGLVKVSLSREFDVIIYLGVVYHVSTWVSCFLAGLTGKKTYMWSHGFIRPESGVKGKVRSLFYRLSDGMLLYHHRAREIFIDKGFRPEKLDVLYNSLDVDKQKKIRESISDIDRNLLKIKLFKSGDIPVLLWIGRLTAHKRLDIVIDAVSRLKVDGLNVGFILVGEGPEKNELFKRAHKKGLGDQVVFYGPCHNEEEIGPIISMSDICVAPGEVGLTCMHSLVYGTPVITHDDPDFQMPEYEAIQEGVTGSFFKYNDLDDLVRVIAVWLNSGLSRNDTRSQCFYKIDEHYNPNFQLKVIDNIVRGKPSMLTES